MQNLLVLLLSTSLAPVPPASAAPVHDEFATRVAPFVRQNCAGCHNDKLKVAGLSLTAYQDSASMLRDRAVWEKVTHRIRAGEMPPRPLPRPDSEAIRNVTTWIDAQFTAADRTTPEDPGHLTAHRLNRAEYNNTIRDLLAVDAQPASDFPADDSGYGFDNVGDVLSVSPVLLEKYLNAATRIAYQVIPSGGLPRPTRVRYSPEHNFNDDGSALEKQWDFPAEGDYQLRIAVNGVRTAARLQLSIDGKPALSEDVKIERDKPRSYEASVHLSPGKHLIAARLQSRQPTPDEALLRTQLDDESAADLARAIAKHPEHEKQLRRQHTLDRPPIYLDTIEWRGPYHPQPPPLPAAYHLVFRCGHNPGQHMDACLRPSLANLEHRAFRRPVDNQEVDRVLRLVREARRDGSSFDEAMRVGIEAILVSPSFLFRIEHDGAQIRDVSPVELASRLSYFLWSSMPDDRLLHLAETGALTQPKVLQSELRRLLADSKSEALVDNFGGQWLELRNLESVRPDPDEFPAFNAQLRSALYTETHLFLQHMVRDDASVLDFIDGRYSWLNERLAKFYGIPGVTGDEFRRVSLDGAERSGILTQGSVLAVTSYPTRTSPVLRGKWILENVLNAPPPPPPPGVGSIDAKGGPLAGTMRQQMEKHRADPMCAGCHTRMDPLGFALENYNAIGQWRTTDAGQAIDASGRLPDGHSFQGSAQLKAILMANRDRFAECLTEKMLTYALGRGVDTRDNRAVRQISDHLASNGYRFSALVDGIASSVPFRMSRSNSAPIPVISQAHRPPAAPQGKATSADLTTAAGESVVRVSLKAGTK